MDRRKFLFAGAALAPLALPPAVSSAEPSAGVAPAPFFVPPQPPLEAKGGIDIRVLVRSAATNGVYSCVETAVAPKHMGPAPHAHQDLDELMYVLEGTASVLMQDEVIEVPAGGWHLRPRRIKHTFWNASTQPLRFLDMYFNQPFEDYLEQVFHRLTPENGYPEGSERKRAEVLRLAEKFGIIRYPEGQAQRLELMKRYDLNRS
jgi:mannose-6-phosphate isomerase-like protein (cupin superfamily)